MITLEKTDVFVFDLDDTLYSERDFETSGITYVWSKLKPAEIELDVLLQFRSSWIEKFLTVTGDYSKADLLKEYREHKPQIKLYKDAEDFILSLKRFGTTLGIITDGRSITQRNKIDALKLTHAFDLIIISEEIESEKPDIANFKCIEEKFPNRRYIYIGDNFDKDFISPNKLNWITIGLLNRGENIHHQNMNIERKYRPQYTISSFEEIVVK